MTKGDLVRATALGTCLALWGSAALADKIDGDWCSPDGKASLSIDGPRIVTSSGVQTTGDYSRHAFSYIVPDGAPAAGAKIDMQLLNEEEVEIHFDPSSSEIWRRCKPTV